MLNDFRYAVRVLRSHPGFTIVAVLTLALGIGANTAIFSVIDHVLLRRAPVAGIDRLAVLWETDRNTGTTREPASWPDFVDYRQRSRTAEEMAAVLAQEVNFAPSTGEPVRLQALAVTAEFLPMIGVQPLRGRLFTTSEARVGCPNVALISEG